MIWLWMMMGGVGMAQEALGGVNVEGKTREEIVKIAADLKPTERQFGYMQHGMIGFIHFGPNTFTGKEWGNGKEAPKVFAPSGIDTDQWCESMKAAGIQMVVMTLKHHDGYVLWQSKYEKQQTIRNSPYMDGQADCAKLLSASCKKYGLKFGVYLSPADLFQIESKDGYYGNGSQAKKSVIPTEPSAFLEEPTKLWSGLPKGGPVFEVVCDDYNRYYMNQLYELLTQYGQVWEVWLDGANPKPKGNQKYDYAQWYAMVRKLAPKAVIFGKGPDVRWCGNEAGKTRESEWNVIPLDVAPEMCDWPDMTGQDLGSLDRLASARYLYYYPCETNTSIRHQWFFRDEKQQVRTAEELFDIYERAVGGNSVFMLNVPPNREGKFSPRDVESLYGLGKLVKQTYGVDWVDWKKVKVKGLNDLILDSYVMLSKDGGQVELPLKSKRIVNRVRLQEAIRKVGQRVEEFVIEAMVEGQWKVVGKGTTIGYQKIVRMPDVETDRIRVKILRSRGEASIAEVTVHYRDETPPMVVVKEDASNRVELLSLGKDGKLLEIGKIYYTIDGSEPTEKSNEYRQPFVMADGGVVKARSINHGKMGMVVEKELGIARSGWQVKSSSAQGKDHDASMAIDGDSHTYWMSQKGSLVKNHPHTLTIDLGGDREIAGILYLPRQDQMVAEGMIEEGGVQVSLDGQEWKDAGVFLFSNLQNSPTQRAHRFEQKLRARYVRLVTRKGLAGNPVAAVAEIGVLAK